MRRGPSQREIDGGRGTGWGGTSDTWEKEVDSPSTRIVWECEERRDTVLGRAVWTGRTGTGLKMMDEGFGLDGVGGLQLVPLKFGDLAGLAWPSRKSARSAGGEIWEEPRVGLITLDSKQPWGPGESWTGTMIARRR